MTRAQLEHVIRAAGIANVDDVVAIGSQAVLGEFPDAPAEFLVSDSDLTDSTIGERSPFQRAFGYYAHGVDETTAILQQGWRERLILATGENTRFVRGWWLEIHYLAIAKYAAGREKDRDSGRARRSRLKCGCRQDCLPHKSTHGRGDGQFCRRFPRLGIALLRKSKARSRRSSQTAAFPAPAPGRAAADRRSIPPPAGPWRVPCA